MEDVREILFYSDKVLSTVELAERCRIFLKRNGFKFSCKPYDNGIYISFIEDTKEAKEYAFVGNESESMIDACQFVHDKATML